MGKFDSKVALVTGGSSGIGLATAGRLAREGASVVITGTSEEKGGEAATTLGPAASFIKSDIRDETSVKALVDGVISKHGKLDMVVNSAGVSLPGEFDVTKFSVEDFDLTMNTNVKGVFLVTKHAIQYLIMTKGSVVNIASTLGLKPLRNEAFVYTASKAAVIMFTKAMALSYRDQEVRINCVCPGAVETPLLRALYSDPKEYEADAKSSFLGRYATPEEIAGPIVFLLSDQASYITGAVLSVDGGSAI